MKAVFDNIPRYLYNGRKDKFWYSDTRAGLVDMFPGENIDLIIDILCATSMNTSLKSNVTQFFKAFYMVQNDEPFEGFLPAMIMQLDLVREGKPLTGRKIGSFSRAVKGDKSAIVVDIWIMRAFGIYVKGKRETPSKKEYDEIEKYLQCQAPLMNLEPRQMCSMIWSGIRTEQTGKSNTTRWDMIIRSKMVPSLFPDDKRKYTKKGVYIYQG